VPVLPPLGESLLPRVSFLRREVRDRKTGFLRVLFVDPRLEFLGTQTGERQQQIAEISLRIDDDRRDAVDRGFLEQRQTHPRLSPARHANTDGVGDQVLGVVEEQVGLQFARLGVAQPAEVKDAELFEVLHGLLANQSCRPTKIESVWAGSAARPTKWPSILTSVRS